MLAWRGSINAAVSGLSRYAPMPVHHPPAAITPQTARRTTRHHFAGAGWLATISDIRGAGSLLGDEQSGHIKEVGYRLYQQMLNDAVAALKSGVEAPARDAWSPTITLGTPVTLPDDYVPDLNLRLQLYRRLSTLETDEDIEIFAAEMIDRFGPMPEEPSNCSSSSPSRRCAARRMSRRSTPARRASLSRSATIPSPIRPASCKVHRRAGA